jgi:branched-chain amino acid transport system permease protein
MSLFAVSLIGGIVLGSTYALIALGIVLVFRATSTFNFAHGQFMLLPAYFVGAWQARHSGNLWVAIVIGLLIIIAVGIAFYSIVLQRTTGLDQFMAVIATLGLASVLDGVMLVWFGSPQYSIHVSLVPTGTTRLAGADISTASLALAAFSLVIALGVAIGMRYTHIGRRVRAAGQNPLLASQGGINVRWVYLGSWALASLLAGLAGIIYGTTNIVGSSMTEVALSAFPAILIGGLDSIGGAILGGLLVGIFQGFIATYLNPQLMDVLTYSVLLVVMLLFPSGLLGTKSVTRV